METLTGMFERAGDPGWFCGMGTKEESGMGACQKPTDGEFAHKPKVGISTCLLGERVRYDGGHKRDRFLTDTLGRFVTWVPVCPEVECGLGVPRESMHLEGEVENPRLITTRTRQDCTNRMSNWAAGRVRELEREDLVGFVFKSKSPSSGMERIPVWDQSKMPRKVGVGVFARAFMRHFPLIPAEEDGRLHDLGLRENFIERIFCLSRYRTQVHPRPTLGKLVAFHARHKLQLMSHSPKILKEMGNLVAHGKQLTPRELCGRYERHLLDALKLHATVAKHVNVLDHMSGYFKRDLDATDKIELREIIRRYRCGLVPLMVPLTLLMHYVNRFDSSYLRDQTYLNPHPWELKLRNHA